MSTYLQPEPSPLLLIGTLPTTLAQSDPLHPISHSNVPSATNFPDSPNGRNTFAAFQRLHAVILTGFDSVENDSNISRSLWLSLFSTLLADFHNSIRHTHGNGHLPSVFSDLNSQEYSHFDLLNKTISSFSRFFTNYKAKPEDWDICLQCLEECLIDIDQAEWESVLKSCNQNVRGAHATIVNQVTCTLHNEAEAWRSNQLDHLKAHFINYVTATAQDNDGRITTDPCFVSWIQTTCANLQTQLQSSLSNAIIKEILKPWATTALDNAKTQHLITLDKAHKQLEAEFATTVDSLHEENHIKAQAHSEQYFNTAVDALKATNLTDIAAQKAELDEMKEADIAAYKHQCKIRAEERKEKIHSGLIPDPSVSSKPTPASRTNHPKMHVDPITHPASQARPRSLSQSLSWSHAPSPVSLPPGWSLDMTTPCVSPSVELLPTRTLTEPALVLQPPLTNVSVGPPSDSFEERMMLVDMTALVAVKYPRAASSFEPYRPPNMQAPIAPTTVPSSPSPSASSSTEPPTDAVMAAIRALSSQLSSQISALSS